MPNLSDVLNWIEQHDTTIELLKWLLLILVAWAVGLFRYLRNLTRKPCALVSGLASRCLIEEIDEYEGHRNVVRAALLLEVEVSNRSSEPIVVRTMEVRVRRPKPLFRWGPWLSAVSLPNRVQHQMGSGVKLMRNWFATFPDGIETLTIRGRIEPKDAESGFVLFVAFTHGNWNPEIDDECVRVGVRVHLTTGERLRASARVPATRKSEFFEQMVPGVLDQIRHPTAWNLPPRF